MSTYPRCIGCDRSLAAYTTDQINRGKRQCAFCILDRTNEILQQIDREAHDLPEDLSSNYELLLRLYQHVVRFKKLVDLIQEVTNSTPKVTVQTIELPARVRPRVPGQTLTHSEWIPGNPVGPIKGAIRPDSREGPPNVGHPS